MSRRSITPLLFALVSGFCAALPAMSQDAAPTTAGRAGAAATNPDPLSRPATPRPPDQQVPPKPLAQAKPAAVPPPAQLELSQSAAARLPNEASSIIETYGDWTLNCGIDSGAKACLISQSQGRKDTRQRTFAIELHTPKEGRANGVILMPFGLRLEAGAILKLNDKDLGRGISFSTCEAQGCLLPVSLPTAATDAIKTAEKLTVAALNLGSGKPVVFAISLKGFGSALDRATQIENFP